MTIDDVVVRTVGLLAVTGLSGAVGLDPAAGQPAPRGPWSAAW